MQQQSLGRSLPGDGVISLRSYLPWLSKICSWLQCLRAAGRPCPPRSVQYSSFKAQRQVCCVLYGLKGRASVDSVALLGPNDEGKSRNSYAGLIVRTLIRAGLLWLLWHRTHLISTLTEIVVKGEHSEHLISTKLATHDWSPLWCAVWSHKLIVLGGNLCCNHNECQRNINNIVVHTL